MVVIGEWVFLQNAAIDFLLLAAAGRLCRLRLKPGCMVAGAALGGVYAVAALYWPPGWYSLPFALVMAQVAALGSAAGFGRRLVLGCWVLAAGGGLAGVALALGLLWQAGGYHGGVYLLPPLPMWLLSIAGVAGGCWLRADTGRRVLAAQQGFQGRLTICHRGRQCHLNALVDTGSTLREPISGLPVAVASAKAINRVFGDPPGALTRHAYYATLAGDGQVACWRPDSMTLRLGGRVYRCDGYIGLSSADDYGHGVLAIVPVGMLQPKEGLGHVTATDSVDPPALAGLLGRPGGRVLHWRVRRSAAPTVAGARGPGHRTASRRRQKSA